jgi:hypothetical protein
MKRALRYGFLGLFVVLALTLMGCGFQPQQASLSNITVTATSTAMVRGTTQQLTASGQYSDGTSRQLSSEVVWTSSNPSVATVSATGVVTAVAVGVANIYANVGSVAGVQALSIEIHLTSVSVSGTTTVQRGTTQQLTLIGKYDDNSTAAQTNVTWTSSDPTIASISTSGVVTGLTMGTVTVTGQVTSGSSTFKNTAPVNVIGVAQGTVDTNGSTITVGGTSPVAGTKIEIPAGAVNPGDTVTINVDYATTPPGPLPAGVDSSSNVIILEKNTTTNFNFPINVTIPVDPAAVAAGDIPTVFYWNETYSAYEAASLVSIDKVNNTVTFQTVHFSKFIAGRIKGGWAVSKTKSVDTGFRPDADGFFHPNFGSYITPGGSSLGMALYTSWYYADKKKGTTPGSATGPLYTKYLQGDPTRWQDDTDARELIYRAYVASSVIWAKLALNNGNENLNAADTAQALLTALTATKVPQVLILRGTSKWAQAVLVYGWDADHQRFLVYDPNFPGDDTITLSWDTTQGATNYSKAAAYPDAIQKAAFAGMSIAVAGPEFELLYSGIEGGWSSSQFVKVAVNAPQLDANDVVVVPDNSALTVQGSVSGGVRPPTTIVYYLNGQLIGTAPISSNAFNFSLPTLPAAANNVMLVATDQPKNPWAAYAGFKQFTIKVQGKVFFTNPGFETGDWTGWAHETHTWYNTTPGSFTPEKSAIVNATDMDEIFTNVSKGYSGNYAARVNNYDWDYHISTASQTVTVPSVANPEVRFYWAAILEDPQHPPEAQPYVDVTVTDLDTNTVLYTKHFYSNDPSYSGWIGSSWKMITWQPLVLNLGGSVGHQVKVTVTAADCGYGGHGGYVYLDGDEQ